MGSGQSGYSQADYDRYSSDLYESSLQYPCILPDIGIDKALLQYSGNDSNAVLQAYSAEQMSLIPVDQLQDYIGKVESVFSPMSSIPHAVGIGAFLISMILELSKINTVSDKHENTFSMFQRVFAEEKASSVRDTMSEWETRHRMFLNKDRQLREEIQRLEKQLSNHLTILRNSLLLDGQMSTRGFKIWVNGAAFHVQMLIFEAKLNPWYLRQSYIDKIKNSINSYLQDLEHLQEEYKTYKIGTDFITFQANFYVDAWLPSTCTIKSEDDKKCGNLVLQTHTKDPCGTQELIKAYMNVVFSKYNPVLRLKTYFLDTKMNLMSLINQQGSFTPPSAG